MPRPGEQRQAGQAIKGVFHVPIHIPECPGKTAAGIIQFLDKLSQSIELNASASFKFHQGEQPGERTEEVGNGDPRIGPQAAFGSLHLG